MYSKYNILEIHEMIDYIENFLNTPTLCSIGLGEMLGTNLLQLVVNAATPKYHFNDILIIEGCQDYIGLYKKKLCNHVFYASVLLNELNPRLIQYNSFVPSWCQEKNSYKVIVNDSVLKRHSLVIVNNADLIDKEILQEIINKTSGKNIIIGDPFGVNGEDYMIYPTLVDSLHKMNLIMSTARQLYDIETRAIDRDIKTSIKETRINRKSVGKIDKNQYVTNDNSILDEIRYKQSSVKLRKGQKIIIASDMMYHQNNLFITRRSMGVITHVRSASKAMSGFRLYNSKDVFISNLSYSENKHSLSPIYVKPANILSIEEVVHHRFSNIHLVMGEGDISIREYYNLLKITNNLDISRL